MWKWLLLLGGLLLGSQVVAQNFSLYPTVDPVSLAKAFNITDDCLDALNTTLPCDATLFQMAQAVDNYWWEVDNLTSLCTRDCFQAVEAWDDDVSNRCYYDTLVAYNKIVPADSVSGRYSEGFHVACLTSGNSSDATEDTSFCLTDSQDWVGSDFVRPDCTIDPTNAYCTDPTDLDAEATRIANLYGDDVLCSECFIQMMYQRLQSPYLPDHDFSEYLIGEYFDILDVCNYTDQMPELIIRAPPDYVTAIPPPLNLSGIADTTCKGQTIVKSTLDPNANCNSISQAFGAATGNVQAATNSTTCSSQTTSFCLQPACTLQQVPNGATCESLATAYSTANLTVTAVQFLSWNQNINGLCDSLTVGDYVCASAPGGSYIPPLPPAGSVGDGGQQRGGGDGSSTSNDTFPPTTTGLPTPTQTGIVAGCKLYAQTKSNDYCQKFIDDFKITPDQFYTWNTILGADGVNCTNEFWESYWYCVAGPETTSTPTKTSSSSTATPTSTGPAIPSPTQSGIAKNCNKYVEATSNDYCYIFAQNNGITTDQLYAWNTILGAGGADCSTMFQANVYYCVGVSS